MATTLQPGQRAELDITDIAFGGDGIGRVEGFVVFVPFVIAAFVAEWIWLEEFPADGGRHFRPGLVGVGLFAEAWL